MKFTDSHCHFDFNEFNEFESQRTALLAQCAQKNIHQIVIPTISPDNWHSVMTLCSQQSAQTNVARLDSQKQPSCKLYAALGIHPWFLNKLDSSHLDRLAITANRYNTQYIAIGETGIDGVIAKEQDNLIKQETFFDFQLSLAKQVNRAVIVHHRQSHHLIVPMLKQHKLHHGGIIHAFSGNGKQAKDYLDLGFYLGVGGTITYSRATKTIKAIQQAPLTSLVLETDAPSMPLAGHQGEANSPLRIIDVFNRLVEIRSESAEVIAEQLELNVAKVYQL